MLRDSNATKREEAGRQVFVLDDMSEKDPDGNLHGHLGVAGSESVAGCAKRFATSSFTTLTDTSASPPPLPIQSTSVILVSLCPTIYTMVPLLRLSHTVAWRDTGDDATTLQHLLQPARASVRPSRPSSKQASTRATEEGMNAGIGESHLIHLASISRMVVPSADVSSDRSYSSIPTHLASPDLPSTHFTSDALVPCDTKSPQEPHTP